MVNTQLNSPTRKQGVRPDDDLHLIPPKLAQFKSKKPNASLWGYPFWKNRRKLKQQSKPESAVKGRKNRILQGQNKNLQWHQMQ